MLTDAKRGRLTYKRAVPVGFGMRAFAGLGAGFFALFDLLDDALN